ncbi:double zinc ribbon domain-containing protein [Bradyrhizobium elkanii]|uniref:double zinc ribbon domain-containing protein n=1 Tax=Bradyrhizobium elkanii TaxID=29448 RepID=UPI002FF25FC7
MQCLRCGCQNRATNEYCEGCGASLGTTCGACGHLNGSSSRFCGKCGAALTTAIDATQAQPSHEHSLRSLHAKGGSGSASRFFSPISATRRASSIASETPNWACGVCSRCST